MNKTNTIVPNSRCNANKYPSTISYTCNCNEFQENKLKDSINEYRNNIVEVTLKFIRGELTEEQINQLFVKAGLEHLSTLITTLKERE